MPFDSESLSKARSQGYTDDQIYDHLAQSDERFLVAKQNGYSLDDIAAHLTKGGEQKDEEQIRNQPQADSQGDAGREANQQVAPVGSQNGIQADGMLRPQDQGQRQRDDQARLKKADEGMGGVQPPAQGFVEQIKTEQGQKAGLATLVEEGVKMAAGTVAAGVAEAALVPEIIGTGGVAAVAIPAVGMASFLAGSELAEKILVKPVEKLFGIEKDIEAAKQAAPDVAKVAGYAAMAPFLVKSAIGFAGTAKEAAAKALEGEAASAAAKAVGRRAAGGAIGGAAFEPIRYGFEEGEKMVGITEEAPSPITLESVAESSAVGAALGGAGFKESDRIKEAIKKGEREKAKTNIGENMIADAGLPETAKIAAEVKTDNAIEVSEKTKQGQFVDPNKRAESLYQRAEIIAEKGDAEATEKAIRMAENATTFEREPASDWVVANRQARADAIRQKAKPAEAPAEAQLTIPSETKVKETSGVSPEQGVAPIGEAEGQIKEGTPQRESEGQKEVRIGAAAWRNERTGQVFYGRNHEEAVEKARQAAEDPTQKDKVVAADLPKVDTTKAENRETPDFGFVTTDGEFVSREEAQKFAEQSGQFKGKQTDRPVMHSNEVQLDFFEKKAPKPQQFPGAASKTQFTEDRLSKAVSAMEDAEKTKGRTIDVNNEGDKRAWLQEINKRFDLGTFTLDEQNSLWNQAHEAYRIRNAAGKTIPIERAVQQIGGERIQSQRELAAKNDAINKRREARGDAPLLPGREITQLGAWQEAAKRIAEDPQYLYNLTTELKQGKRAATAEESLALLQHRGEIENRIDDLSEQRNAETDQAKIDAIDARLQKEYNDLRDAEQVYRNVGTEVSAALRIRRIQALADFSFARSLARKEKAIRRKLDPKNPKDAKTIREIKSDSDKVKNLTDEISGLDKKRIEERKDADIETQIKPTGKKSNLSADDEIKKFIAKLEQFKDNKKNKKKLSDAMLNLARAITRKRIESAEAKLGRKITENENKEIAKARDITQATHDIASKILGNEWGIEDTRNAISKYGIYTEPDQSALSIAINRLTGENRAIGKIETIVRDLAAPDKTGKGRLKPSSGERAKNKLVNKLLRKFGIKTEDPETQLVGAMNAQKTRLQNLVEELEDIAVKGRPLTEEARTQLANEDPEIANLKGEILGLRQLIEDTYGKREIPMEQKVKSLERIYDNLIKRYEKEIAAGEVYKTTSKGEPITSEKIEQQRETLKNLRAERQHIRDADSLRKEVLEQNKINQQIKKVQEQLDNKIAPEKKGKAIGPKSAEVTKLEKQLEELRGKLINEDWYKARKEALALQGYKTRINSQIEEAKRRLATGDYSKIERKEMKIDEEARLKRLELAELKDRIRQNITLEEWKNRTPRQKAVDATIKFKRAAVLSYLSTWGKLTAASFEIPILRIPTAVAGKVLERTPFFREIAQKARQEYGTPLSQDFMAYAKGLRDGAKEFGNIAFKLGRSQLDLEYGDTSLIPLGALDIPGKIHEAIKNPTKRANYEMAYARYMQWATREGLIKDAESERLVREKAGIEAYKEANASIFLQDNGLVNKYNLVINKMKESDSWRQRLAARFLEFNIPIVRIPANIVKEALEYQFGFFTGTSKAIKMKMSKDIGKRLEDISPEDADNIMRQIKKGSVGLTAMAIGYALPDYFGGFYRKGAEKDEEAPEYGGIGPIPKTLLHHPAFVPFQIGATLRRVWDESFFDRATFGDDAATIARGFAEGQMGLLEELPFVNLSRNVGKYVDPSRMGETAGEYARSMIPGAIQEVAKVMDVPEQDAAGVLKTLFWDKKDVTKRKAETFLDHVYEGIPVLRERVDTK